MKREVLRYVVALILAIAALAKVEAQEYRYTPIEEHRPKIRTEMGVGFGGVYTGIGTLSTEGVELTPRFGFAGRLDFGVRFGRHFALETEVAYQGGSLDISNGREERRVRTKALDIPLFASLRLANNMVHLGVGPVFTVMSRGEYTKDGESQIFGPINPTWNVAASIGVCLAHHYLLELRYTHALAETLNQFEGEEFTTRSYRIAASFAVIF